MKFESMKEFVVLAETLNYLEASERLYISQSSLSKHIKEMEQELGVALFNRSTRKVSLTDAGLLLLPYARKASRLQEEYTRAVEDYVNQTEHTLSIGISFSYHAEAVNKLISEFQELYPDISVHMFNYESEQLIEMVHSGVCDCIFIREDDHPEENILFRVPVTYDTLRLHVHHSHRLAGQTCVSLEELKDETFLMGNSKSLSFRMGTRACADAGFTPNVSFQGNRSQILACLNKGLGISLLFGDYSSNPAVGQVVSLDIRPAVSVYVNLLYSPENQATPLARFVELVKSRAEKAGLLNA